MKRRELMLLMAGALTAGRALRAHQKALPVIGFLSSASPSAFADSLVAAFRQGLSETGYVDGQNVMVEHHWEGSYDRVPALAAELVRRERHLLEGQVIGMDVHVPEAGHQVPAFEIDHLRVAAGAVRLSARQDGADTAILDQHGSIRS